jgi:hypothetical protein
MATPEEVKKQLLETSEIVENTLKSVAAQIGDIFQDALSEADNITKIFGKDVEKQLKSLARSTDKMVENQLRIKAGQASSRDITKQILEYQTKREVLEKRINNLMGEQPELAEQLKNQLRDVDTANQDYIEGLQEQEQQLKRIEGRMGVLGKLVSGLSKIPILGNLIDAKEVETEMKKTAAKTKNTFAVMGTGIFEISKSITKGLTDPLTILTFFLNAGLKADKQVTELAKSLGVGKDQATQLRQNFVEYSRASGDAFVTTDKLIEAQGELTQELGIAAQYSGKTTEDFSRLTKLMGLSASEAGKLARVSLVNGKTIEDTTKSIIRGSAASQRANKISIDQRTILKDVANLSEGILIKFQNNPEALGAAVVQARALGLTLDQVDKTAESLLNFESSIENELKAELITGRQLNFERARAAALTGDQAALMQEIGSQVGTLEDFQNMNVIAQKSLAEAFGMSRDEVSKMLIEQEKVKKLGDVSKMTLDQQLEALKAQGEPLDSVLYKQIQQQSAQEKFNNAIEKLQELIGNLVAGPLGQLIDAFATVASSATAIKIAMGALIGMSVTRLVTGLAAMVIPLVTGAAASTTMMSALTLGVGLIAILGSIAAISSAMNSAKEKMAQKPPTAFATGGIVTSRIDNATVGEAGPEAIIPLNSPRANRMFGGGGDNSMLVSAINELRTAVNALANKPTPAVALNVNGQKLGEVVGRQPETGTNQYQNAYRVA